MAENGGCCCRRSLAILSLIFKVVGVFLGGFGGWLKKTSYDFDKEVGNLFNFFSGILIFQGAEMIAIGGAGIYYSMKNTTSLKKFGLPLVILAVADIIIGLVFYYYIIEFKKQLLDVYTKGYDEILEGKLDEIVIQILFRCCGKNRNATMANELCDHPEFPPCPERIHFIFNILEPGVLVIFLGTAALMIVSLLCLRAVVKRERNNERNWTAMS